MIKIVVICLSMSFISSCSTYEAIERDVDRCIYSMVDPDKGTVKGAIDANLQNWYVNSPHCNAQFDQLGIK